MCCKPSQERVMGKKSSPLPLPLPDEVIMSILLNLPVKSLLRFKCVCKLWLSWIIDQDFIHQHLLSQRKKDDFQIFLASHCCDVLDSMTISRRIRSSNNGGEAAVYDHRLTMVSRTLPRDSYKLLDSCDGILCFFGLKNIFVCNPSTREFQFVVFGGDIDSPWDGWDAIVPSAIGFGRNEVTKEIKIVRIFGQAARNYQNKYEVFTLGPNPKILRKSLGKSPAIFRGATTAPRSVCVKGAIYWIALKGYIDHSETMIVSFDLHSEKFKAVPAPNVLSSSNPNVVALIPLRNSFCLAQKDFLLKLMKLWIFREDGNCEKLYSIDLESVKCTMGFPFVEHKEGLIAMDYNGALLMYNPKSKTFTNVRQCKPHIQPTAYIESLVPLYGEKYMGVS